MKIESSDVKINAQTTNELDIKVQSSLEFKKTLLSFISDENENNAKYEISLKNKALVEDKEFKIKSAYVQIAILNLEFILIEFLGINKKVAKVKAHEYCSCENINVNENKTKLELLKTDVKFQRSIEYKKKDSIEFTAKAIIKTNNKDINLDLKISYSKEFYEKHEERLEFSSLNFIDPLIIQYKQSSSSLDFLEEEMTFKFDLDSNNIKDELACLKEGNGFLALDKNHNKKIDNGLELFGPSTNNAFAELRAYDIDENSWIDENDDIFKDLLIFAKDEKGEDKLISLNEANIGAIYLNNTNTRMSINKSINEPLAQLKSTSFFLREDGSTGLLSSLDFIT